MKYKIGDRVCLTYHAMMFGYWNNDLVEINHGKSTITKVKFKIPFFQQRYVLSDGTTVPEQYIKPIIKLYAQLK